MYNYASYGRVQYFIENNGLADDKHTLPAQA